MKPTENSGSDTPGPILLAEKPRVGCGCALGVGREIKPAQWPGSFPKGWNACFPVGKDGGCLMLGVGE